MENVVGLYDWGNWNRTGEQLINFWHSNDFFITNIALKQPKWLLYALTSPGGEYIEMKLNILLLKGGRGANHIWKTWPRVDYRTHNELFMYKFQVKLQKKKKTSQFPWYDLNIYSTHYFQGDHQETVKSWLSLIGNKRNYGMNLKWYFWDEKLTLSCRKQFYLWFNKQIIQVL